MASSSVFHHQHGVAQRLQPPQRAEQPFVIALVQPNAGFVQHIQHARQPAAYLAGEPDALALAAGEGGAAAGQGQVFEPDIVQEAQPLDDFFQDAPGDRGTLRAQRRLHATKPGQRLANRKVGRRRDVLAPHAHGQGFRLEPGAVADFARFFRLVAGHFLPHPGTVRLLPAALQIVQHALERLGDAVAAHAILIGELDRLLAAQQDHVAHIAPAVRPMACGWSP